jgi:hypothetical protein
MESKIHLPHVPAALSLGRTRPKHDPQRARIMFGTGAVLKSRIHGEEADAGT